MARVTKVMEDDDECPRWLEPRSEECSVMEFRPWKNSEEYNRVELWTATFRLMFTDAPNDPWHPCEAAANLGKCYLSIDRRHDVVRLFVTLTDDVDVLVRGKSVKDRPGVSVPDEGRYSQRVYALGKVLEYLWADEQRDYKQEPRADHIFKALLTLRGLLTDLMDEEDRSHTCTR